MADFGFVNNPPAYMGFVGFVRLKNTGGIGSNVSATAKITHDDYLIRATSADINLSQDITSPDVVDSRYDRTVYQLGPKVIDGSISFPVVFEVPNNQSESLFEILYRYAVTRKAVSGLLSSFDMEVKYASSNSLPNEAEFLYTGCVVNTWQFAVAQSDVVTCSFDIIGIDRTPPALGKLDPPPRKQLPNCDFGPPLEADNDDATAIGTTRIVTWNDARVEITGGRLSNNIGGQYVRTFEANINNDVERFYTLNTKLFAQAIAPRKREISGNLVLMGRHQDLGNLALTNEKNCTETTNVKFGYSTQSATGEGCGSSTFNTTFPNCVFEIETMGLTNDIFESTINWQSLPSSGTGVCDPLLTSLGTTTFEYEDLV